MEKGCELEKETTEEKEEEEEEEEATPGCSSAEGPEVPEGPALCRHQTENQPGGEEEEEEESSKLSVISWNVDGLDPEEQPARARGLCWYLTKHSPDVVLLQEIILPYYHFLKTHLEADYKLIPGGKEGYFVMMLLRKSRITLLDSKKVKYPLSKMMRNLLIVQVTFRGQKLCLMTSHLESCKGHAPERMRQLRMLMNKMTEQPDDVTVLFGGDTNLRDKEVARMGVPSCVCDVWVQLGEPEHCRYTWDTETNTNKAIDFKCRFRFDRLYLRRAAKDGVPQLQPDSMTLIGLKKLKCGRYVSDHWGIYCTFTAE